MDDIAVYDPLAPPQRHKPDTKLDRMVTVILGVLSWFLIIAGFPFSMLMCLRIVREYERVVSCTNITTTVLRILGNIPSWLVAKCRSKRSRIVFYFTMH
jgi:hypothetical protein